MTLHIVNFSSVADTYTYASGLPNVIGFWANTATNEATAGYEGINVAESSGTFTFYLKTTSSDVDLYILSMNRENGNE